MATPGDPTTPPASDQTAGASPEWTQQVTNLVTDSVDKVRSRTTGPLMGFSHGVIYGVVATIVAIPVTILAFVGVIRLLNWAIPGDIWIIYMIIAVAMWVSGWILWSRRGPAEGTSPGGQQ